MNLSLVLGRDYHADNIGMNNLTNVCYFRYEQEIHKRNDGENEFVMLKKVGGAAFFCWKEKNRSNQRGRAVHFTENHIVHSRVAGCGHGLPDKSGTGRQSVLLAR